MTVNRLEDFHLLFHQFNSKIQEDQLAGVTMEFAKSLFQTNAHEKEGYVGVNTVHKLALVESASDDPDGEVLICSTERTGLCQPISPKPGVPFSAVTPSMWPQTHDLSSTHSSESSSVSVANGSIFGEEILYDEFGFRIDEEDGPEQSSNKLLGIPFTEDPSVRLQWMAQLEFSHSRNEVLDLSWDSIPDRIVLNQKLWEMMTHSGGIPHSLRPHLWPRLAKKSDERFLPYWRVVKESTANEYFSYAKHVEKDLARILPSNGCFTKLNSPGIPRLRRQLRALAWLYPDLGYCQGLAIVVAHLLLFLEEENSYQVMCSVIQEILPSTFFLSDFVGIRLDCLVISHLVSKTCPAVHELLKTFDVDITLIVFPWILTLFSSVLHVKILLRVWDLFFSEGDVIIFRVILAMLKFAETEILELKNSPDIFNFLSNLPASIEDFDSLEVGNYEGITKNMIDNARKDLCSQVLTDGSSALSVKNGNRKIKKRSITTPKKPARGSILSNFFGDVQGSDDVKNKNVRQTELMVDLHDAIHQIGRHFMSNDPRFMTTSLEADFSLESHEKDHDRFSNGYSMRVKRAKALVDFERRDDDELGFRRNDILIVVNSKDEHCWVGELNGLRGWFPAKFVSILDERSKEYSPVGDDSVTEGIADLVRGILCPALKRIFEHGIRNPGVGPIHPWLFIEEVAAKEIERDYRSVHSRLILCNTYKLDEDGKVLSPEEILYRCVELVNRSHEKVQMDVKLRSLICLGLNEQVLHLWIEILCSSADVVSKWYHPWSFLNSPGWVGLKCELRVLSHFSFTLSLDWELRPLKEEKFEVKNGLRDMLVKHHLFSWNLN